MATWPFDDNYTNLKKRIIKPANLQTSSAGYTMSFPKGTVKKRAWVMEVSFLSLDQADVLEAFFDANQGLGFDIQNPDPNLTGSIGVIFDQDEIELKYVDVSQNGTPTKGEYKTSINVREI
jgi:hypothetical protein